MQEEQGGTPGARTHERQATQSKLNTIWSLASHRRQQRRAAQTLSLTCKDNERGGGVGGWVGRIALSLYGGKGGDARNDFEERALSKCFGSLLQHLSVSLALPIPVIQRMRE